ncbi:MAG: hypothetical protein WA637_13170 [Terriglobales bacterium]
MASDVKLNDTPEKGLLNPGDGPPSNPTGRPPPGRGAVKPNVSAFIFNDLANVPDS